MLQSLYVQPFWLWLYDNLLAGIGLEDVLLHSRLTDCHQVKMSKGCKYSDSNIFKFEPSCPWNKLRGSFQGRQSRGRVVHGYFIPTARVWDCPREIENCEKTFYPPSGNFSQTFVEENSFPLSLFCIVSCIADAATVSPWRQHQHEVCTKFAMLENLRFVSIIWMKLLVDTA